MSDKGKGMTSQYTFSEEYKEYSVIVKPNAKTFTFDIDSLNKKYTVLLRINAPGVY